MAIPPFHKDRGLRGISGKAEADRGSELGKFQDLGWGARLAAGIGLLDVVRWSFGAHGDPRLPRTVVLSMTKMFKGDNGKITN